MIAYPEIDPVVVAFGPVKIHWYGMMYLIAFASVWWLGKRRAVQPHSIMRLDQIDDLVFYGALGAVLGGRIGSVFFYNTLDDIKITDNESWYFLARNNYFLSLYREHLRKAPHVFVDKTKLSVKPADIAAINLYETVRKTHQMTDQQKVKLQFYVHQFDLRKPWFDAFDLDDKVIGYYRDVVRTKIDIHDERLMVNTIHGVKGGEADNVVLLLDVTRAVKTSFERNADAELRCLYVACTRAKKHLHIVHSNTKNGYDDYLRFGEMAE